MNIPGLPAIEAAEYIWNMADVWRQPYVDIKFWMAERFKPQRICEIGVYSGISAKCFLAASPSASYVGIDSLEHEGNRGITIVENTRQELLALGYKVQIIVKDSQSMESLPGEFDFIHLDGDHSRKGTYHDVKMAWEACTSDGHILIDNAHNTSVAAGVFDAMNGILGYCTLLKWEYHPEAVGNILLYKEPL